MELGLDRIKRFDYRWGFHGPAIQSILGAVVPAPRTGILALFDQPTFDVRHLPPLPGGLSGFTVFSLDAARVYDQISAAFKVPGPRSPMDPVIRVEAAVKQATGLKLRDEILAPLGSRVVVYTVPSQINAPPNVLEGLAHGLVFAPKTSVVVEVKDRDAAAQALEAVARWSNRPVPVQPDQGETISFSLNTATMRRLKGPDLGYVFPPSNSSLTLPMGMRQTLLLGRNVLAWGMTPATARRARDQAERAGAGGLPPGDPLARTLDHLPDRLTFLNVVDPQQSVLPEVLVSVPNLIDSADSLGGLLFTLQDLSFLIRPDQPRMPTVVSPSGPPTEAPGHIKPTPAFDPELIPEADELRPFLFPSVSVLAVDDQGIRLISREAFPTINPAMAVPLAIAMLVPSAHSARDATGRSQSLNHLKQIGLALLAYEKAHGHFPADIGAKEGTSLLSWRVQLLPFLDEQDLFHEFKLDEPWDSPHNMPLVGRMPSVFAVPNTPAGPGLTFYRGVSGAHTIFDPKVPEGVKIASITDGTSNTIAVIEAKGGVLWTKPQSEVPFVEGHGPAELETFGEALSSQSLDGLNAVFCDGSVRFLRNSVSLEILKALITRDGGEVLPPDSF